MAIDVGEGTTIKALFYNEEGNLANPVEPVTIVVKNTNNETTESTATRESLGTYIINYTPLRAGVHNYTVYTGETPPGIQQDTFTAKAVIAEKA